MTIMQPEFKASRIRITNSLRSLNSTSTRIIQNNNEIRFTFVDSNIVASDELIPTIMSMSSIKPSEESLNFLAVQLQLAKKTHNKVVIDYEEKQDEDSINWSNSTLITIDN